MANRFKEFIESIVFAGLKPSKPGAPPEPKSGVKALVDRMLNGPAVSDPLYLTNQTFGQKMRRAMLAAIPVLLVGVLVAVGMTVYAPKTAKPTQDPTPKEIGDKLLPMFNPNDLKIDSNHNLQVDEVTFSHAGGDVMTGKLTNTTDHVIHEATVVFHLTDVTGSQLGDVKITEIDLPAGGERKFRLPIDQNTAEHAVVRDILTH